MNRDRNYAFKNWIETYRFFANEKFSLKVFWSIFAVKIYLEVLFAYLKVLFSWEGIMKLIYDQFHEPLIMLLCRCSNENFKENVTKLKRHQNIQDRHKLFRYFKSHRKWKQIHSFHILSANIHTRIGLFWQWPNFFIKNLHQTQ